MTVRTEGETRIEDGTGTVVAIERKTRNAKVSLEVQGLKFPVSAWMDLDHLNVAEGDRVEYEIRKEGEDYRRYFKLAPITTQKGSGGEEAQMAKQDAPQSTGHGDAHRSGDGGPIPAAERAQASSVQTTVDPYEKGIANSDTARFEGWAFVANVGMVDLAYEELSDALEAGELDSITPELLKTVATHLLNAADQAQRALVGRTDRAAQSHTRARGCVRTALRKHPVRLAFQNPVRDEGEAGKQDRLNDIDQWSADIQKTAVRLLKLAASL